jgi:uncharacterized lipoprotein YddW (UPF0748 family)
MKKLTTRYYSTFATLALLLVSCCHAFSQYSSKHEMRGIWIATVANIDWPSSQGLTADKQKEELVKLLDEAKEFRMNTVVFQVRPAADALYSSKIEPWSQWLTGKQGKAPEPFYDPLGFAVTECRKRGLDIHAWLNPYRALTDTSLTVDSLHITKVHPEWFLTYGKTVYFDPGLPQVRDYVSSVVADIVRRYDIDAIHMDDYFYPYRIAKVQFPDDSSFLLYGSGFPAEKRDDWRRQNVNLIIKQIADSIKSVKEWVEFGISPFGVWRNRGTDPAGSDTKAGQTNYDDLFADILLWQREGWIDYVTPQIYWHIGKEVADYAKIADWWSSNTFGCRLYIGQAPYRIDKKSSDKQWHTANEIINQVRLNRSYPNIAGSMYFSAKVMRRNPLGWKEKTLAKIYKASALPPENNRITSIFPASPGNPVIAESATKINLSWEKAEDAKVYIVYRFRKGKPADTGNPGNIVSITSLNEIYLKTGRLTSTARYYYAVSALSRTNTEGETVLFKKTK